MAPEWRKLPGHHYSLSERSRVDTELRRLGLRIPLELPVHVRWKAAPRRPRRIKGKTADISGNGLFMAIPARLRRGTPISFSVELPAEITSVPIELVCRGEVVRKRRIDGRQGVAAIIMDYWLRPVRRKPRKA